MATETRHKVYKLDIHRQTTNGQRGTLRPCISSGVQSNYIILDILHRSAEGGEYPPVRGKLPRGCIATIYTRGNF